MTVVTGGGTKWFLLGYFTQREDAQRHLRDITGLEQVRGLENLLVRNTVLLGSAQEGLKKF